MRIDNQLCLVTGGAGFIGSHLVDELLKRSCRVRVLDDFSTGKESNLAHHHHHPSLEVLKGSILDMDFLKRAMQGVESVFHLACRGVRHSLHLPFENHQVNALGSLNVLHVSKEAEVKRFLYCSTSEVYGTAEIVPMPENHPTHPCTVYGASKLAGESYTRAFLKTYGFPVMILRIFNNYGPRSHHEGDSGEVIPKSIVRALNKEDILIFGDGKQTRDFNYVEETAKAIVLAMETDACVGHTLNFGSGVDISINELAEKIAKICDLSSARLKHIAPRPGDVLALRADAARFNALTEWQSQISFEDGLHRTVEYFRDHPKGVKALLTEEVARNWE